MSTDQDARIAALTARLDRVDAERGCLAALYRYGHAIDYGDETTWIDCFVTDAVYDIHFRLGGREMAEKRGYGVPHDKGTKITGHDELKVFIARHTRAPDKWHKHMLIEPAITVADDCKRATARSYFTRLDDIEGERVVQSFGRYLDKLVACPDGLWRVEERIVEVESVRVARN